MRHGFYVSDCDDLVLTDCDLKRYSKHGFRCEMGCDRVTMRRCTADCSEGDAEWEKKTELFPFGFNVNDGGTPNTALTFTDCLARNNLMLISWEITPEMLGLATLAAAILGLLSAIFPALAAARMSVVQGLKTLD